MAKIGPVPNGDLQPDGTSSFRGNVIHYTNVSQLSLWQRVTRPGYMYKRRWIGSSLVQVMACRREGDKPLPKPVSTYQIFSFKKMHLETSSAKRRPFCHGLNVFTCPQFPLSDKIDACALRESHPSVSSLMGPVPGWRMCASFYVTHIEAPSDDL